MRRLSNAALSLLTLLAASAAVLPASAQSYNGPSYDGYGAPGYGPPGDTAPAYGPPDDGAPAYGPPGDGAPAYGDSNSGYGDPGYGDPAYNAPYGSNYADSGSGACDYYTPPWGYPPDYCNYQLWTEPVFFGGYWYEGPIYYRNAYGAPYFWINGGWHRDEWRGARPRVIDWGHGNNIRWNGAVHRDARRFDGNRAGRPNFSGNNFTGNNVTGNSGNRNFGNRGSGNPAFQQPAQGNGARGNGGDFFRRAAQAANGGANAHATVQSAGPQRSFGAGAQGGGQGGGRHRGGFTGQGGGHAQTAQNNANANANNGGRHHHN